LISTVGLPSGYLENRLILMAQSPRVLYVYWELSPGQKTALANKSHLKLRLNKVGSGTCRICDIDPLTNNYYFDGVEPGILYNCDLSVIDRNGDYYPFIFSNTIMAPPEKPGLEANYSSADLTGP
jgi:hypothetical protein